MKEVLRLARFERFSERQIAAAREDWKRKQAEYEEQETKDEQEAAG